MGTKDRVREQTDIRRAMLKNGYTPLANINKACYLPGWSKLQVDDELIDEWSTALAYQSTGLRIDPPLLAIDVDIDDREMVDRLWSWAVERFGEDWESSVLIRLGGGAKETWLCRVDEPFSVPPGPKYVRPEIEEGTEAFEEADRHKVELFGGGSGRQIGSYGSHTPGERPDDEPLVAYRWVEGKGPHCVPLEELPCLTKDQAFEIVTEASRMLEEEGWTRCASYNPDDFSFGERRYDLEEDMEFFVGHGTSVSYDELGRYKSCRMKEITGEGTNTERGRVYVDQDGNPWVWDSQTGVKHLLASTEPEDTSSLAQRLGERLQSLLGASTFEQGVKATETRHRAARAAPEVGDLDDWHIEEGCEGLEGWERMEAMVDALVRRYAYHPGGTGNEDVVDMRFGTTFSMRKFQLQWANKAMRLETGEFYQKGGADDPERPKFKQFNPADLWVGREDRVTLAGFKFDPATHERLLETEDGLRLNIYQPPRFDEPPGDPSLFLRLVEHLLPNEEEREWFLNWCAYKVQNPAQRGQGVVMVTPTFGTGRGTLFSMLTGVVGERWVASPRAGDFAGLTSQSQFDEWKENALLVTMNEVAAEAADYRVKKTVYEHLKDNVDPGQQTVSINQKGRDRRRTTVYYSTLMASNHFDALPLTPDDRRFTILENTQVKLEDTKLYNDLAAVRRNGGGFDRSFLHGVRLWLLERETVEEDFFSVLHTPMRDIMVGENESVIEEMLRKVLDRQQFCVAFLKDVIRFVEMELERQPKAREAVRKVVRSLLLRGFNGWVCDPNKSHRVRDENGDYKVVKGVAEVSAENSLQTPEYRYQALFGS